jgi:uncharacterized protein YdeI (YjbR/CyaY-like superfamily)
VTPTLPRPSASDHPATWKFDYPIYHVETRPQWRSWLEHNHGSTRGMWLCSWRTGTGRPRCPYPEVVEEAICFGWIDSTAILLDDDRGLQLITPRKAKSPWSRLNRQRADVARGDARTSPASSGVRDRELRAFRHRSNLRQKPHRV